MTDTQLKLNAALEDAALGNYMDAAIADRNGWIPAEYAHDFNPQYFDFRWNGDYTKFRAVRLRWTDDASYAAYQADPGDDYPCCNGEVR